MDTIKRSVVLCMIPLLFVSSAFPQGERSVKVENLYSVALFASIAEMEKSWGYIDDSDNGSRIRTDYHHMLVVKNPEFTDNLPPQSEGYRVEYLDNQAQIDRYKKLRNEFAILEIHPMKNEGAHLKITVSVSHVTYKKGRLILAFSDWSNVDFRYDCGKGEYVISGVELGGI